MKKSTQIQKSTSLLDSNRKRGDRDEERIARIYDGQVVAGSGSTREKKGDVVIGNYLGQAKRTNAGSISVKLDDLRKIQDQALSRGKRPLYFLTFYQGEVPTNEWIAMPTWMATEYGVFDEKKNNHS